MKVVVSGYTYTRTNLFEVFESYPEREGLFFILPNNWKAKNGTVRFEPFLKPGFSIYHSPAFFFHSNYPIIGGLLKGWMPFFIFRLIWLRFIKKADILFTTGEPNLLSTLYNAIWAKFLGMKHVFHYWENIPYTEKDRGLKLRLKKALIRMNMKLSDGAIAGMHKAEDILRGFDSNFRIGTFLHAGFNTERFTPGSGKAMRQKLGLGEEPVFLFVGALGYRKGIHLAVQALADEPELKKARLLIVGSGEYEETLKKQTADLGLEDRILFIPWMANEDLPRLYAAADVFLYPSIPHRGWEEQFGYSIAEASLCELSVIATKSGSIDEVLRDGETGIMVAPDDALALREAMVRLAQQPELRRQLGRQGREFIKKNFSNQIIAQKLYYLFKDVSRK